MTTYEIHWIGLITGEHRVLAEEEEAKAKQYFQTALDSKMACKLVKVERYETILAAWDWREGSSRHDTD